MRERTATAATFTAVVIASLSDASIKCDANATTESAETIPTVEATTNVPEVSGMSDHGSTPRLSALKDAKAKPRMMAACCE